jgi:hypothetical protein
VYFKSIIIFFVFLTIELIPFAPFSDGTLFILIPLAEEYQIESIREKCQQYVGLNVKLWNIDRLLQCLLACDKYHLEHNRQALVKSAANVDLRSICQSPWYKQFDINSLTEVLIVRLAEVERCARSKGLLKGWD